MFEVFIAHHQVLGGSGKRSLPMVCPIAIGKAFGLAAATRRYEIPNRQQLPVIGPAAAATMVNSTYVATNCQGKQCGFRNAE